MAEQNFWTLGTTAKYVSASPDNPIKITNGGDGDIGRKATADVASTDSALTTGQSATLTEGTYVISASSSHVIEERYDRPDVSGAFRGPDVYSNLGPPKSGPNGTGVGTVDPGTLLIDSTNGVLFFNENTSASPYWTPINLDQPNLFGMSTDFRNQVGKALADTAAELVVPESGLRIFGEGVQDNGGGGLVVQTATEGGSVGRVTTGATAGDLTALGMEAGVMQPDQHKLMVVDTKLTSVTDIDTRANFVGFIGTAADALAEPVTGGTTTATFVQDDVAGIFQDTGFTDTDGLMLVSEKANTAGTQTGLTAAGALAAAGTYQRFRVEVDSAGEANAFLDKAHIGKIPGPTGAGAHSSGTVALDPTEEYSPVFYVACNTGARIVDVQQFSTWAYRA